ncbi:tRNA (adenosine(37)-N6)-threonylcarbamoyltransferase complex dimerization subunit type 1 TsaB [Cellulomonas shaoxiangyii]|uniref:tRNA (Adenosine(37)-N6)-threonylcarbamoyltransferase complex dimerization subunit type 1 TsaB n=1 Tax=Cellulomonas shaoxiangyii TaxID=2566013 RepID=A0A4P7SK93_9CELL|nr:tRNA (adenosine(37)-N6)-threonylcarbamoyltransferase complex dimerization subunit type 1 TsaB [Cellulomonas shaoxiangyii]QCB92953.1 tRNA (adenosine(37)-N6)-threonylcarbamoyltransferase complex dimerization subunit type 1 TsaB [Cellulomonas shaoxiangyii]TGY79885.1 tRNA (adenosine(37)-N6)-threonylcarbamoyltransferase complex dimerization subunit type 1 TsaB [Cellulomonas shaoxiangyii]
MTWLGIDTSDDVAVGLVRANGAGAELADDTPRRHVEQLAPLVHELLTREGVATGDLEAVVVGTGPAPFTGLRVGLVTARVLGLALGVPVLGVPSLDALAAAAADHVEEGETLLVVTDARRREVYWARYEVRDGVAVPVAGPDVAAPADVPRAPADVVLGAGRDLYPDVLGAADPRLASAPGLRSPSPIHLVRLAQQRSAAGQDLPSEPLYLRRPDAQPPTARKRVLA